MHDAWSRAGSPTRTRSRSCSARSDRAMLSAPVDTRGCVIWVIASAMPPMSRSSNSWTEEQRSMANEREGSGIPSWAVAAVAILGIVGFMWWISSAAQPRDMVAITEGDDTAAETSGMTGEVVGLDQIAMDASGLVGRDIILEDVTVAAGMGQQAFWIDLPNQQPFLIRMGGAVVPVQSGDVVDVAGRM